MDKQDRSSTDLPIAVIDEPSRAAGLRRLESFAPGAGTRYTKARNFDFGPERRGNVSLLSPFVRHRLVLEEELLETVLGQHSMAEANKFLQEVFWRTYYKGWLEHHPAVWEDYRSGVSQLIRSLESDGELLDRYSAAVEGRTGIDCFDAWAAELVATGYLHNHARMWFASIWVYTLNLPWQLGADFFYRHLIDGDPASNTLSWRWVCGLHTRGKTYIARAENIAAFSNDRFNPQGQLATSAPPLTETRVYPIEPLRSAQVLKPDERFGLLVTEEDCEPESLLDGQIPVAMIGVLATTLRSPLPVGEPARNFGTGAVSDALERASRSFGVGGELAGSDDWGNLLVDWATQQHLTTLVTAYAPSGPVAELLVSAGEKLERYGIRLLQIRRLYDSLTWPHAKRGYFKLKRQIPDLLQRLDIAADHDAHQDEAV